MSIELLTGRHIARRTFLRASGVAIALPFLDAMVPAGRLWAKMAPSVKGKTRLICIEEVHGLPGCNNWGASEHLFAPETVGRDFVLKPENALKPVEAFRDYMTIISNTDVRMAEAWSTPEIGGDHFRSSAVWLTQSHPKQTQGSDLYVGTSLDQIYAQRFGQDTALPSMQFSIENLDQAGGCTYNYSCAYTDSISWASPERPLPMIRDPRVLFDMMFGAGSTPAERLAFRQQDRSILDWIVGEVAQLKRDLGASDRQWMDRYLDNIREIERRIQLTEARNTSGEPRAMPEAPAGVPDSYEEHIKILFDLQVLALQSNLTRVIAFKTGRDASNRTFPESGSSRGFHPASHHGNRKDAILEFNKICQWRIGMLPHFLERLKTTMDGESSLLDQSMVVWGSPMADANLHNHRRCPLVLFGRANGQLAGNLHLQAPDGTPMANVMLTLMHKLGMDDLNTFGDSTGAFPLGPVDVAATAPAQD
jgi:hypothetical protein